MDDYEEREWDNVVDPSAEDHYSEHRQNPLKTFIQIPTFMQLVKDLQFDSAIDVACSDAAYGRLLYESGTSEKVEAVDTDVTIALYETKFVDISVKQITDVSNLATSEKFDCVCGAAGPNYLLNRSLNVNHLTTTIQKMSSLCNTIFIGFVYNPFIKTASMSFNSSERSIITWQSTSNPLVDGAALNISLDAQNIECFWYSAETIERIGLENGFASVKWIKPTLYSAATEEEQNEYKNLIETPPFYAFIMHKSA